MQTKNVLRQLMNVLKFVAILLFCASVSHTSAQQAAAPASVEAFAASPQTNG
jgi:hypothetical protein